MCLFDDSLKRAMKNKSSTIGDGDNIDITFDIDDDEFDGSSAVAFAPPSSPQLASHSQSTKDEGKGPKDDVVGTPAAEIHGDDNSIHNNNSYRHDNIYSKNTSRKASDTIERILPNVVWLEHILPCLDRPAWNAMMEASKPIYMLATLSKLSADYHRSQNTQHQNLTSSSILAQPPWPTNRSFQSKSGGQGQAIESIAMSHDGEFLACGSVIGSIDIWNLRTGKIQWKTENHHQSSNNISIVRSTVHDTTLYETAEEIAQVPNYFPNSREGRGASSSMQRRTAPLGSVLRFSQGGGYTLACGFENRVFVWDLERELLRKKGCSAFGNNSKYHHQQTMTKESTPSLPLHKQHHIFVPPWKKFSEGWWKQQRHSANNSDDASSLCYQILEIECNHGNIYDVTYLGFSDTFGSSNKNRKSNHRLVARYGKTAHIWTTLLDGDNDHSVPKYVLTHSVSLQSSRCQMISNPSLTLLAVATNGGGSRRSRQTENDDASIKTSERKGIVHVWDLEESLRSPDDSVTKILDNCSTEIVAYPKHVLRGLEFLRVANDNSTTGTTSTRSSEISSDSNDCLLVSASLQGEVKFWKKYKPAQKHPRDRYSSSSSNTNAISHTISNEEKEPRFVCVYQFQSPGKIFSLASWSSPMPFSSNSKILLAAGEARGQVRVWKVSPLSLSKSPISSSSEVSVGCCSKSKEGTGNNNGSKQERLEECLSTEVGDHVHYDNIKLLAFTPNGNSLAVSRAYDSKIWFQTVWQ